MKELEPKKDDKIEVVKQQQKKQTIVLQNKIVPNPNHVLFEYNTKLKTICLAEYEPHRTDIHWHEAKMLYDKKVFKKINLKEPETITKAKVIKKENCIYISALNKENVIKILERDFGINL